MPKEFFSTDSAIPFTVVYIIDGEKVLLLFRAPDKPYCPNDLLWVAQRADTVYQHLRAL